MFELLKLPAQKWKMVIQHTPVNLLKAILTAGMKVDTEVDSPAKAEGKQKSDPNLIDVIEVQHQFEERINDLEALGGVYRGMIEAQTEHYEQEIANLKSLIATGGTRGHGRPEMSQIRDKLRAEVLAEVA